MGSTCGSVVSPVDVEPFARTRTCLAEFLSIRIDMQEKHRDIVGKIKFSDKHHEDTKFVQAIADSVNKGLLNINTAGFNMSVDDSLFVQTATNSKHAIASIIEALYIVLGYPDTEKIQSPLSLDT